ncbi:MAG: AAA family ATPase [Chloroflexi bacterium]|nr:AAA family ATPase [Chloroflexota bacterium]
MYKSFRVKNFRCFKDLQINDLGRVNLIAGKNNTGKTALMEAMYILAGDRDPRILLRKNLRTAYRLSWDSEQHDAALNASDIINWSTIFRNLATEHNIELYAALDRPLLPLFLDSTTMSSTLRQFPRDSADYYKIVGDFFFDDIATVAQPDLLQIKSEHSDKTEHLLIVGNRVIGLTGVSKKPFESEFIGTRDKQGDRINAKRFSDLRRSVGTSNLCKVLRVIEPRISGLELLYDGYRTLIFADIGLDRLLALSGLGEGIQRMASLTLAMTDRSIGLLFIDEIENGIHYSVQKDVWKAIGQLARELDVQVFATTHSLEMIRAAYEAFSEEGNLDEFRYHRLDRDRDTGEIEAVTYNELDLDAVATFDFDYEVRG